MKPTVYVLEICHCREPLETNWACGTCHIMCLLSSVGTNNNIMSMVDISHSELTTNISSRFSDQTSPQQDYSLLSTAFGNHSFRVQVWATACPRYNNSVAPMWCTVQIALASVHPARSVAGEYCSLYSVWSMRARSCSFWWHRKKKTSSLITCSLSLSLIISYTANGWPSLVQEDLLAFHRIKSNLKMEHGCLLCRSWAIISRPFRAQ